jgi:hypothetical protein
MDSSFVNRELSRLGQTYETSGDPHDLILALDLCRQADCGPPAWLVDKIAAVTDEVGLRLQQRRAQRASQKPYLEAREICVEAAREAWRQDPSIRMGQMARLAGQKASDAYFTDHARAVHVMTHSAFT